MIISQSIVYEGSSETIPSELMHELVHDVTIGYDKRINRAYFLINLTSSNQAEGWCNPTH